MKKKELKKQIRELKKELLILKVINKIPPFKIMDPTENTKIIMV